MKTEREFKNRKEFFRYLKSNKKDIIELKKSGIKFSEPFRNNATPYQKSLVTNFDDDIEAGIITRTIIGNTYNWMDSYSDVLVNGAATRTLQHREGQIKHLHDHQMLLTAKVGNPLSVYERSVSWKQLGIDIDGRTTALMMDSEIKKSYNEKIFEMYLNGEIDQHSIGFFYQSLSLAVNDDDEEFEDEYKVFKKYIDKIGNKEDVIAQGYFFAVTEIKLLEISAVIIGANELTGTIENESKQKIVDKKNKDENNIWRILAGS